MQSILILGRQPQLGLAELESLYVASSIKLINNQAVGLSVDHQSINFKNIGGSIKLAKFLHELPGSDWDNTVRKIAKLLPKYINDLPEGKIKFGLSAYGFSINSGVVNRSSLFLKKTIKTTGRSVRIIPNNETSLGSAQVIHNQLTSPLGIELLVINSKSRVIIAQTVQEQDIKSYATRDHGRPKRDSKVGMLPPKLAQIIINLAVGDANSSEKPCPLVLDPFCGTGVILQEACLMGYRAYGADLEKRMIDYTNANLLWLTAQSQFNSKSWGLLQSDNGQHCAKLEVADATRHQWSHRPDFIACETYLGRPFSSQPEPKILQEVMQDVNLIHKRFLQNVARQTEPGFRLTIAVPAWHIGNEVKHLKILDNLEDLGYNRIEFVHVASHSLIYHREGQIVGRELVVLVRK